MGPEVWTGELGGEEEAPERSHPPVSGLQHLLGGSIRALARWLTEPFWLLGASLALNGCSDPERLSEPALFVSIVTSRGTERGRREEEGKRLTGAQSIISQVFD